MTSPINDRGQDSRNPTVTTLSATTIELGHASDTTLARAAAGRVTAEGVAIVRGPGSATDNAVVRFDATTGDLTQNSAFVVDDSGHVTSFGGNIAFPATQVSSAGANVLDDYEEGSFTSTLIGSATAGSQGYSIQVGRYVKIGQLVTVGATVALSSKDAAMAGNALVGGMPFTSENVTNSFWEGGNQIGSVNLGAGYTQHYLTMSPNTATVALGQAGDNIANVNTVAGDIGNSSVVVMTISYRATA